MIVGKTSAPTELDVVTVPASSATVLQAPQHHIARQFGDVGASVPEPAAKANNRYTGQVASRPAGRPPALFPTFWPRPEGFNLGHAYDAMMAGRVVDSSMVYEASRGGSDKPEELVAAAELAALGVIDSKGYQQVATNWNVNRGTPMDTAERVAVARIEAEHGCLNTTFFYGARRDTEADPLLRMGAAAGLDLKNAETRGAYVGIARAMLTAAVEGRLWDSSEVATILRDRLRAAAKDNAAELQVLERASNLSARGLVVYGATRRAGETPARAMELAHEAEAGHIDAAALQALARPGDGRMSFEQAFGTIGTLARPSFAEALSAARDIARGELTFGQIHGFSLEFLRAREHAYSATFGLPVIVEVIKAVNRGELAATRLHEVFDIGAHYDARLVGGVSVPASLSAHFSYEVIKLLASGSVPSFRHHFNRALEEHLPKRTSYLGKLFRGRAELVAAQRHTAVEKAFADAMQRLQR